VISDGSGGAIVAWQATNTDIEDNLDIYARRVDSSGVPQWSPGGVAICTDINYQYICHMTHDGIGGAIIAWMDTRNYNYDIYAQRVDNAGVALWTADGIPVCSHPSIHDFTQVASDGAGGAIVVWVDFRNDAGDLYASRILSGGTLLPAAVSRFTLE
jgi:hypothetical protein